MGDLLMSHWVHTGGVPPQPGCFQGLRAPSLSISDYLLRIRKYFLCSDECFVLALAYIDRLSKASPSTTVCDTTAHRLLLISVMIAAKFHDDVFYDNSYYARVGGVSVKEVNALEARMLELLNWRTQVTPEEYQFYYSLVCCEPTTGLCSMA